VSCAILGDSIAVGIAQHLPECAVHARVGVSAAGFAGGPGEAGTVVISLGSNDSADPTPHLDRLRSTVRASRVVWIVPATAAAQAVRRVAARWGDGTVELVRVGADRVHPDGRGYQEIAQRAAQEARDGE
jgi:lysophospholipase L1-like esterase